MFQLFEVHIKDKNHIYNCFCVLEQIGDEIIDELGDQRESLIRTRDRVRTCIPASFNMLHCLLITNASVNWFLSWCTQFFPYLKDKIRQDSKFLYCRWSHYQELCAVSWAGFPFSTVVSQRFSSDL